MPLGHPFYVHRNRSNLTADADDEGDWVLSKSLRVGDLLNDKTGAWKPILSIEKVAQTKATYNFEVKQNHDYFVGENGWLVHNQSLTTPRITNLPLGEEGVALEDAMTNVSNGTRPSWLRSNSHWGDSYGQNPPLPGTGHQIFDVRSPNYLTNRGARRIITNDQRQMFYTPSHYRPGPSGQPPFFQIR